MSPNAIRRARPGFILTFAGALATSGAEDFGLAAVGGGDFATSGAAGGADEIFGAGGDGVVTAGGGGGAAVVKFLTDGAAFGVVAIAILSGRGFDTGFLAAFFCADVGSDF